MTPAIQSDLRRTVRRMVYASCRRTMDGGGAVLSNDLVKNIRTELGSVEETGLADETLGTWINEDEDSFENAVLISELVTKNIGTTRTSAPVPTSDVSQPTSVATVAPAKPQTRRKPQTAPGIADMLDDMLSQQRDRR